jgi:phytoene synthase
VGPFEEEIENKMSNAFASKADYEECRRLHRQFGTTYYFATQRFPKAVRNRVHAVYGFVRVPDEWVDNPGSRSLEERSNLLRDYRNQLLRGLDGVMPAHPVLRAFVDVCHECRIPVEEPLLFLDAMKADLTVTRYPTYEDLRSYMRGSASTVGVMMCYVVRGPKDPEGLRAARVMGEAMQLTNFLRDVKEDAERGRIYIPLEDLELFGVHEDDILNSRFTPKVARLIQYEIERARALYAEADPDISRLSQDAKQAVLLARVLYSRILDRIEAQGCNVFAKRARTSRWEKLKVALQVLTNPDHYLKPVKREFPLPSPPESRSLSETQD